MKQQPIKKKMPFTRDDYYAQLDVMLGMTGQTAGPGDSFLGRIRQAVANRRPRLPGLLKR
ncbi:MAG: hypothetical protein UX38_C0016G0003 [Microgenomates group bacterium GW2011_GWC1_46_16]|nr:MAG: hypothetical protein UX38_C0016G0003 [Microgenomates group bacterium GW2011_GWC1_46_16]